jgi:hypothetical protein
MLPFKDHGCSINYAWSHLDLQRSTEFRVMFVYAGEEVLQARGSEPNSSWQGFLVYLRRVICFLFTIL